jgi:hypothetical protein
MGASVDLFPVSGFHDNNAIIKHHETGRCLGANLRRDSEPGFRIPSELHVLSFNPACAQGSLVHRILKRRRCKAKVSMISGLCPPLAGTPTSARGAPARCAPNTRGLARGSLNSPFSSAGCGSPFAHVFSLLDSILPLHAFLTNDLRANRNPRSNTATDEYSLPYPFLPPRTD